jgi:multisubunit Na+/H+ antiporter MnhG subunit
MTEMGAMFISLPWMAFIVALAFLGLWRWRHGWSAMAACGLWSVYGAYEHLIHARIICSGECNIRVDLLVIYPVLVLASAVALWRALMRRGDESAGVAWARPAPTGTKGPDDAK